jgi:hypothetical protein
LFKVSIDLKSITTSSIMAAFKRTRVCDTELEDLEQQAKKHIKNIRESKSCATWAAPLWEVGRKPVGAKEHLETLNDAHRKLTSKVRELRAASVLTADGIGQAALEAAKGALATLNKLEARIDNEQIRSIISTYLHVGDVLPSQAVVLPKIEYYKDNPQELPKEVRDLNNIPNPALVLDDEAEIRMNAFRRQFDRASCALLKVRATTKDSPLTVADLAVYANYIEDQLDAVLYQFATKEGLQTVVKALKERRYLDLLSSDICSLCCEDRADVGGCQSCFAKMYSSCFGDQLTSVAEDCWTDPSAISRLATLRCDFCKAGTFNAVIREQLPPDAAELYVQAVEHNARASAAREARMDKRREYRIYRALPNKKDKQYRTEREALVEMLGVQCPSCASPFADYEACCSLQCSACSTWFCALCFNHGDGSWSRLICHTHVKDCMDRPQDMDDAHFYPLHLWKRHTAMRQHKLCAKYLEKTDFSPTLKGRLLLNDFPRP